LHNLSFPQGTESWSIVTRRRADSKRVGPPFFYVWGLARFAESAEQNVPVPVSAPRGAIQFPTSAWRLPTSAFRPKTFFFFFGAEKLGPFLGTPAAASRFMDRLCQFAGAEKLAEFLAGRAK
jgi:hypothetical protein